jgi:chlorobactene glucosyltransferase
MILLLLSLLWCCTVAWLLARAIAQFRHYERLGPRAEPLSAPATATVSVVIPARNEADNIQRCVRGLLAQDYPPACLEVVVVDDGSQDRTPEIVAQLAREHPRVRLVRAGPLPEGWAGKPHACWRGTHETTGDWICLLDADTLARPPLLSAAVHAAQTRCLDMLSLEPFQILTSFWERLVIPAGFFLVAFTQDLRRVNDPTQPDAVANGQFILIRRSVYDAIGGYASVRGHIAEDGALARRVKQSGHRLCVLGGESLIRTRMYRDFASVWQGASRTVVEMVGNGAGTLAMAAAAILLGWAAIALPLWAIVNLATTGAAVSAWALGLSLAGSAAMFATHVGAAVYFRIPFWYGLLYPLGYTLGAAIAINSVIEHARGQVPWKGRIYAPPDRSGVT